MCPVTAIACRERSVPANVLVTLTCTGIDGLLLHSAVCLQYTTLSDKVPAKGTELVIRLLGIFVGLQDHRMRKLLAQLMICLTMHKAVKKPAACQMYPPGQADSLLPIQMHRACLLQASLPFEKRVVELKLGATPS